MANEKIGLKKVVSGVSWSFAEKVLTDAVSLIVTIVLARLLYPEEYGLVALVQIFVNISSIFVTSGMGTALIQKKDASDEQISTIFYLNFLLGLFIYAVIFLLAPYLTRMQGNEELTWLLRVLAIKIPVASVYNIQNSYVKKKMQFKKFFFSSLAGTIASGVVGISMAYMGFGAWALVASMLTDQIMDSIILFCTTRWLPKFRLKIKTSIGIIKYGLSVLTTELISKIYTQLRSLIIGVKYSSEDLAYNSKGTKFPQMVSELTDTLIIRVMFPVLSNYQDEKERLTQILRRSIQISMFVLTPLLVGLGATAYHFIPLLLTDKWLGAIPYMQVFCISYLTHPIVGLDLRTIQALGKGRQLIKLQIIETSFGLTVIGFTTIFFHTAFSITASVLVTETFNMLLTMAMVQKYVGYSIADHIKDNFSTIVISLAMGAGVLLIGALPFNDLLALFLEVAGGGIIYLGLSYVFKTKPTLLALDMARKVLKK